MRYTKKRLGFSLVEILIVVSILGILAAIVFPHYQGQVQLAKESVAKENLRLLRESLNSSLTFDPDTFTFALSDIPENPFNNKKSILPIFGEFPDEATGENGWLYKNSSRTIKLDWPGTDSMSVRYYDY